MSERERDEKLKIDSAVVNGVALCVLCIEDIWRQCKNLLDKCKCHDYSVSIKNYLKLQLVGSRCQLVSSRKK
jgi:hypothetical protein